MKDKTLPSGSLSRYRKESLTSVLFFAPFAILFFVFTILPVITAAGYSLMDYSGIQKALFIGFRNFKYMMTEDDIFLIAIQNTFSFAVISGIIGFCLSFVVAWIIDGVKGKMFFALAFYAPSITGGIAMSVVWLTFFSPDAYGWINNFLLRAGITDTPLLWTQNPKLILPMVCIVAVWMSMGTGFLAFLAGFQNLNKDISEAGQIDGISNKFEELIYIIIPQMKPMLLFGSVTAVTTAFAIHDVPLTLAGSPGPENASLTVVGHINDYVFTRLDMGYSSSLAIFLFALTFLVSRILFRILTERDHTRKISFRRKGK